MTGTNFLNKPDGGVGWADRFMAQGYEIYIVDEPARGRSAWQIGVDGPQSTANVTRVEFLFTASKNFISWPTAVLQTQWPGTGIQGDPIFDAFYRSIAPSLVNDTETSLKIKAAGTALLDRIGRPVILFTHSQSGPYGLLIADSRPSQIKGIIDIESGAPPFVNVIFFNGPGREYGLTQIPITYSPPVTQPSDIQRAVVSTDNGFTCYKQVPPPRQAVNLNHFPILYVVSEAGFHNVFVDCATAFMKDAGLQINLVRLKDVGIHGNGHMMFMEKNSDEIAEKVIEPFLASFH